MESEIFTRSVETIGSGAAYGWLGVLSGALTVGVGLFKYIFPDYWSRQKRWVKLMWVFGTSGVGVGLLSVLGGLALPAAISAGLLGGLSAIGGHQVKKSGEEILREKREKKNREKMEKIVKDAPDLKPKIMTQQERQKGPHRKEPHY